MAAAKCRSDSPRTIAVSLALTKIAMNASSDARGWTIAEAIERTSNPDQSVDQERAKATVQNIAMWRPLADGKLVLTGSFESPATTPVPIDPQIFHALNGPGPTSSALEEQFGSRIGVFNIRVFPVLRAPNAASYLNGLSLADAFRRYVLDDPEVVALGKRVVKTTKRHVDVFRDGMFPGPLVDFHWPLDATAESIEYSFAPQSPNVDDWLPAPSAMLSAVSAALADRIQGLRNVLASGSICAFGVFERTGVEGLIGRVQWTRPGISIDVRRGDLCEHQDHRAVPKWTGLSLRLPDAPLPPNQPQNDTAPKVTEITRKAKAQVQTKEKCRLECVVWLTEIMSASREYRTQSKKKLWAKAQRKWPKKFGWRAFETAWADAVIEAAAPAWSAAGRPRKSSHS
jgi:hypothetical protein